MTPATAHVQRTVEEEMHRSYLDYAMSVIVGRAIPDVRDGLKPVHRRVLYAMGEMGNAHDKPHRKSARVVGDVIGKYHPHGDTAVYDALVRMAQDFSMRAPLVDGQGNFGSVDGDSAAAMRYTEVRLARVSDEMLSDLQHDTVDTVQNYDGSLSEPTVLPVRFPNLLVNGGSGIAVGMATSIPPHNLGEVAGATLLLLRKPDAALSEIMRHIQGPDFPTGGIIHGAGGIKDAYRTGRGTIQVRARVFVEKTRKGDRDAIVITEIPYQVSKSRLIGRIAEVAKEGRVDGIQTVRDESDREGIRVVVEAKKDADTEKILSGLYEQTPMQASFAIQILAIQDGKPRTFPLKEALEAFISFRMEAVVRRTAHLLGKAEAKCHILEGLAAALKDLDAVIRITRTAANPADAVRALRAKIRASEEQAKAILDMRLQRLTKTERDKVLSDLTEIRKSMDGYRRILADDAEVRRVIAGEMERIREEYADGRRTEISRDAKEPDIREISREDESLVEVSHDLLVRRVPQGAKRAGSPGKAGEPPPAFLFCLPSHAQILFLASDGTAHWIPARDIPEGTRKGQPASGLLPIPREAEVVAAIPLGNAVSGKFLVLATRSGSVKKSALDLFAKPRPGGSAAITVVQGDRVEAAAVTSGEDEIVLFTRKGKAIRFHESCVRPMGREAAGVGGIRLSEGDTVIGMGLAVPGGQAVSVTDGGYAKATDLAKYPSQGRNGGGVASTGISEKTGDVAFAAIARPESVLSVLSDGGNTIVLRVAELRGGGRGTAGSRIGGLPAGSPVRRCSVGAPDAT